MAKDADVLQNRVKIQSVATYMQLGVDCAGNLLPSDPHLQLRENVTQRKEQRLVYVPVLMFGLVV